MQPTIKTQVIATKWLNLTSAILIGLEVNHPVNQLLYKKPPFLVNKNDRGLPAVIAI